MLVSSKQRETTCAHQVYNALGYNDPASLVFPISSVPSLL